MSTWKVFPNEVTAQLYADQCWAMFVSNVSLGRIPPEHQANVPPQANKPDQITPGQAVAAKNIPVKGIDSNGNTVESGVSTAWAIPKETASGEWAVPCPPQDDTGGPEPEWPEVIVP